MEAGLSGTRSGDQFVLIAGLGNPGSKYSQTRHNAGFMVVERLAGRRQAEWRQEDRFQARLAKWNCEQGKVLFCQPQTYMNLSGQSVGALTAYYRVPQDGLLVVVDDADLPLGSLRLKPGGSSGGHHGLESIEQHLGQRNFARLRVGIGRSETERREIADYVLGKFLPAERELLEQVVERAADQVECWLAYGNQRAMNDFNGSIANPGTKDS